MAGVTGPLLDSTRKGVSSYVIFRNAAALVERTKIARADVGFSNVNGSNTTLEPFGLLMNSPLPKILGTPAP